jgi:glycosyltransferase involved in cell wall biosynthesis
MIIYFSNPYGTIPGENWRDYRFYLLAKTMADNGHDVVWFTSTFSHHFKKERCSQSKIISISEKFKIHLIKSRPYKKNFSFGRVLRDATYGLNLMYTLKRDYGRPNLFFTGDSPILFYYPSYWYCKRREIPYVVDQMDLWPELVVNTFPKQLRSLVNFICIPIYVIRKRVFDNSSGFIALAQKYLDVPKSISMRVSLIPNAVIYNGIDVGEFRTNMSKIDKGIDLKVGSKGIDEIWFIFAGTLGPSYDLKTILKGFLHLQNKNCKLIIAGDGSEKDYVKAFIEINKMDNVNYIGMVSKESLPYLYSKCDIGLNSYGRYSNVEMSDKFYDYTAAGLAVLNSLNGEVKDFVDRYQLGFNYKVGDINSFLSAVDLLTNKNILEQNKMNSYKLGLFFDQKEQLLNFTKFINDLNLIDH